MAKMLRALAALPEEPGWVLSTHTGGSLSSVTPAPRDPKPLASEDAHTQLNHKDLLKSSGFHVLSTIKT